MLKRKIVIANCPQLEYYKCNYHKDVFGNKIDCSDIMCDVKIAIEKIVIDCLKYIRKWRINKNARNI